MAKKDLLIEIGVEEVPARFLEPLLSEFCEKTKKLLAESRLDLDSVRTLGTMRRLVIFVSGLEEKQKDVSLKIKGPSKAQAFDANGAPTKTAHAFASSKGIPVESLIVEKINNSDYVFAVKEEKGLPSKKILKDLIPKIVSSVYLPISMKWQNAEFSFIRPIHYALAVYGKEAIKFNIAGINSAGFVKAHRFLFEDKKISAGQSASMSAHEDLLKKYGIVLDGRERRGSIKAQLDKFSSKMRGKVVVDESLLNETADLVENPKVLKGTYRQEFAESLPQEVIFTVIKKQQKCFPVSGENIFFVVADGKSHEEISAGYAQVVNARLSDAKFFYDEDRKVALGTNVEKMKKITYHEKIGSMWEKMQRVQRLSVLLAKMLGASEDQTVKISRSAELAKSDLSTHMVGEFPDLAGIMGKYYASLAGEDKDVSEAVLEHYLPRYSGGELPSGFLGAVLGLSDRMDTIASCFSTGIIPTGSEDPYALRRAAQGIVSIILGKNFSISISRLTEEALKMSGSSDPSLKNKIVEFICQRLKAVLENEGIRYDVAEAVLKNCDDMVSAYCKAFEIQKVLSADWFSKLVESADRVRKICASASGGPVDASSFIEKGEKDLYATLEKVSIDVKKSLEQKDLGSALKGLSALSLPLGKFFEDIMVMHEDMKIRNNRLALLKEVESLYLMFADFSKISFSK